MLKKCLILIFCIIFCLALFANIKANDEFSQNPDILMQENNYGSASKILKQIELNLSKTNGSINDLIHIQYKLLICHQELYYECINNWNKYLSWIYFNAATHHLNELIKYNQILTEYKSKNLNSCLKILSEKEIATIKTLYNTTFQYYLSGNSWSYSQNNDGETKNSALLVLEKEKTDEDRECYDDRRYRKFYNYRGPTPPLCYGEYWPNLDLCGDPRHPYALPQWGWPEPNMTHTSPPGYDPKENHIELTRTQGNKPLDSQELSGRDQYPSWGLNNSAWNRDYQERAKKALNLP